MKTCLRLTPFAYIFISFDPCYAEVWKAVDVAAYQVGYNYKTLRRTKPVCSRDRASCFRSLPEHLKESAASLGCRAFTQASAFKYFCAFFEHEAT